MPSHHLTLERELRPPHTGGDNRPPSLWIDVDPRPGWANMALDQALLDHAERTGDTVLRLYRWAPHCLSFGRHEPAQTRYDRERIAAVGLDAVRRPTGGRGVWHARELTYAIAARVEAFGSLAGAYRTIHEILADALARLGAATSLAPRSRTPGLGAGACFAHSAGGEVMVQGRKVVGSAQLRQGSAFLQHGSVLLEDGQETVDCVTRGVPPTRLDAPLAHLLGRAVPFDAAAEAVIHAAERRLGGCREADSASLLLGAEEHQARFRSDAWTWRR